MAEVIQGVFPSEGPGEAPLHHASVAALNLSPEPGDPEGNLLLAGRAIAEARRECPSLRWVVLPELFTCGYSALESVHRYAEYAERGESARFFRALARELGVFIAYGFPERTPGSAVVFDSANLVGPEGGPRDLPQAQPREDDAGALRLRGRDVAAGRRGGGRAGLARNLLGLRLPRGGQGGGDGRGRPDPGPGRLAGAVGTADYELSCAARALDSGVFVASANQIGDYGAAHFATPGHVYGPDGLRASRSIGAGNTCDLDPTAPGRWRGLYGNTFTDDLEATIAEGEPLEACS